MVWNPNSFEPKIKAHRRCVPPACRGKIILLLICLICGAYSSTIALASDVSRISLSRPLSIKWQYPSEAVINITPAVSKESVIWPLSAGVILSLGLEDGKLNWRAEIGGELTAPPEADDRAAYVASTPNGQREAVKPGATLRAISLKSGVTMWRQEIPSQIKAQMASNQATLFGVAADGRIYANRKSDGQLLWVSRNESPYTSAPLAKGDRLFVGNAEGTIHVLEQNTGRLLRRFQTGGAPTHRPVVINQTLFTDSSDNHVCALSMEDGHVIWRRRAGGGILSFVQSANGLLVASSDNFAYMFESRRGKLLWKRQLAGRAAAPPVTTRGEALFTPFAGDECVVLDLYNGKKINTISLGDENVTAASPVITGNLLLLTTRVGLLAYTDTLPRKRAEEELGQTGDSLFKRPAF